MGPARAGLLRLRPHSYGSARRFAAARLARQLVRMARPDLTAILDLPIETRLEIVAVICDSIVEEARSPLVTPEQLADLERRLAAADADPDGGEPWGVVRERIRSSLRR